ncbi:phage integrase N-terminal SAM-like domain-containing protein [Thiomicrorhabdus sp. Milos-T2]|uniref:phage integrase N-terminal SAM-like domain-containing protein n=1 Tax=Thiomicrorhabdus sp. Milos-T2 TaxID=90814 RepID=UPI001F48A723|nr:phage integrase N-terminal SAM-like domain-containing protein [Thiomicrorhabdus sp. Milos-T2]
MRSKLRREGYAYSTENSYCDWVKRFVKFHGFLDRESMLIESMGGLFSVALDS